MKTSRDGVSGKRVHPLGPWGKGRRGYGSCRAGRELARAARAECAAGRRGSFELNEREVGRPIRKDPLRAHRVSSEVVPWDRRVQQAGWSHSPVGGSCSVETTDDHSTQPFSGAGRLDSIAVVEREKPGSVSENRVADHFVEICRLIPCLYCMGFSLGSHCISIKH
jgi:hypothetical protein